MTQPILYDTKRVSEIMGLSQRQVQRLASKGFLPVYKTEGSKSLFRKRDVLRASAGV